MKYLGKLITRILLVSLIASGISAQKYPAVFFSNSLTVDNITLYSNQSIPTNAFSEITNALLLLKMSSIYDHNSQYSVFVVNNSFLYRLLGPDFTGGTFARTNLFNNVLVRECSDDLASCYSKAKQHNKRSLSGLIAHEITHINIRQKLGIIDEVLLPVWKKEGLADHVAQSSSYNGTGSESDEASKSFEYFIYRKIAQEIIDTQEMDMMIFLKSDLQLKPLRDKVIQQL